MLKVSGWKKAVDRSFMW